MVIVIILIINLGIVNFLPINLNALCYLDLRGFSGFFCLYRLKALVEAVTDAGNEIVGVKVGLAFLINTVFNGYAIKVSIPSRIEYLIIVFLFDSPYQLAIILVVLATSPETIDNVVTYMIEHICFAN